MVLSSSLYHCTGKSGCQKDQIHLIIVLVNQVQYYQGVESLVVEVETPPFSGTSHGDVFPVYGTKSMGRFHFSLKHHSISNQSIKQVGQVTTLSQ